MKISEAGKLRILYFLVFCCTASWLPILADYCKEKGLTGIQTGVIISITPLLMLLVQPFYGMVADKLGYKKCLTWSSFLAAISFVFYLLGSGFVYLIITTVCMSVFYNSIQPILDSLALRLAEKNQKFSYGKLRIAGAAGWAFTGIITGQLIDAINMNIIFAISALSMLLTFLVSFSLPADDREKAVATNQSFKNVWTVLNNRTLLFLLIIVFLISAGTSAIWYFYSTYMKENGASASLVGYGLSLQGLCELPLFYFSARIIARLGMKATLLITIFSSVVRLLLYSSIKNPYAAIPIELLHGISWSLFWVVCVEYVNKLVIEEWRATGQSLLTAAYYGAGIIVGNFWTGYLKDTQLKVADIYLLNAGIVFIVGLIALIFMKNKANKERALKNI